MNLLWDYVNWQNYIYAYKSSITWLLWNHLIILSFIYIYRSLNQDPGQVFSSFIILAPPTILWGIILPNLIKKLTKLSGNKKHIYVSFWWFFQISWICKCCMDKLKANIDKPHAGCAPECHSLACQCGFYKMHLNNF